MNFLDHLRARYIEQVVVALHITRPIAKTLAAISGFIETVGLDHRSHRTVKNNDAFAQQLVQRVDPFRRLIKAISHYRYISAKIRCSYGIATIKSIYPDMKI